MTTPTREQIEAEFSAFIEYPSEDKRYVTTASCLLFAEHIARIAHTAGRDQGLREAAARARSEGIAGISADDDEIVAEWLDAAAIEQLRAQPQVQRPAGSAATPG